VKENRPAALPTHPGRSTSKLWALYAEVTMADKRITVWVQRFPDRANLMLQWTDPDTGKRKSKSAETADMEAAQTARSDLEYELNNGLHKEASRMSWEKFRELFEAEYLPNLRPDTRERYADVFNLFEDLARPKGLKSVTERTVSAFAAALRKKPTHGRMGMMPSTIRVTLQFLRTALNWAAGQKMIPACPRFPSVKVPRKKPQPIPAESFERLLAKAPDANTEAFLLTGWLAGLRLSEALALEWEEAKAAPYLDLARDRIILPAEFVKAVEDQWLPLAPLLRQTLEALPRRGARVFRFAARDGHALTANGVSERIIRMAKKAGVKLSMHSLRKGFGCYYAGKVPAQVLQKLMRHGDIKTTMTYYANVDAAAENAILHDERNTLRNTPPSAEVPGDVDALAPSDASPFQDSE
jgi:integrase